MSFLFYFLSRIPIFVHFLFKFAPMGQYPGDYWTLATSLGDSIISGEYDNASDEELMTVLQTFQDTCISYAK